MSSALPDSLKVLLATTYAFSIKIQNFHWNIESANFPQYHKFLDKFYSDVYENTIDRLAETIRQLDSYAPGSLTRFLELSQIEDQIKIPRAELMFQELAEDNQIVIELLKQTITLARASDEPGIENFLSERVEAQSKWGWQLRSILKQNRA